MDTSAFGWVPLARVETELSLFPAEKRLTADQLQRMASAYDPTFRRAPVISGYDEKTKTAGPAHHVGEFLPALGYVEALKFERGVLWGRLVEFAGRLTRSIVEHGMRERSIAWWPTLAEIKGSPPYLRHLAILAAEPAGIAGLPGLEEFLPEDARTLADLFAAGGIAADRADALLAEPFDCRSYSDDSAPRNEAPKERRQEEVRTMEFTKEQLDQLRAAFRSEIEQATADTRTEIAAQSKRTDDAIAAANRAAEIAERTATAAVETSLGSRIDRLVQTARMAPPEAEAARATMADLPMEKRTAFVDRLEALHAKASQRSTGYGALAQPFDTDSRTLPDGVKWPARRFSLPTASARVAPELAEEWASLRAEAGNDPKKFRELAYQRFGSDPGVN